MKSSKFSFEEKVFLSKFLFSLLEDTDMEAEARTALSYCKVGVQPVQWAHQAFQDVSLTCRGGCACTVHRDLWFRKNYKTHPDWWCCDSQSGGEELPREKEQEHPYFSFAPGSSTRDFHIFSTRCVSRFLVEMLLNVSVEVACSDWNAGAGAVGATRGVGR